MDATNKFSNKISFQFVTSNFSRGSYAHAIFRYTYKKIVIATVIVIGNVIQSGTASTYDKSPSNERKLPSRIKEITANVIQSLFFQLQLMKRLFCILKYLFYYVLTTYIMYYFLFLKFNLCVQPISIYFSPYFSSLTLFVFLISPTSFNIF